jgi:hypothetical protein
VVIEKSSATEGRNHVQKIRRSQTVRSGLRDQVDAISRAVSKKTLEKQTTEETTMRVSTAPESETRRRFPAPQVRKLHRHNYP